MLPRAILKASPEDFIVEELPLYAPSGLGDHLYIRFTKRNLTTDAVVRAIAKALGVNARDIGVAGMKDKVGVTTQTVSVPLGRDAAQTEERARSLALDGVTVHEARRHGNKLRTGHLAGNRFEIVLRGVEEARVADVVSALERAGREGAPNAFGAQRFGREQDNAARAQAWLRGEWAGPRDGRARRFLWSSLQSAIFNDVLARRVADGTWATALEGDVLQKEDSGGIFLCTDVQTDGPRAARGEVSPTGPMVGVKMRAPEGAPLALETEVARTWLGEGFDLARMRALGEGARRSLRLRVTDLQVEVVRREQAPSVRVCFVLASGAYATTVLANAVDIDTCAIDEVNADGGAMTNSSSDPSSSA
jgi:tRNA pseudouridine13 synthase